MRTYKQIETAKRRAELAAANLRDDDSRADDFADMSVEKYAQLRGFTVQNPKQGAKAMAIQTKQDLLDRVADLEDEVAEYKQRESQLCEILGLESDEDGLDDDE